MINSTHCYVEKDGKWLMLCRNKKKNDINKDKWIGVGGRFEQNESPEECIIREIKEETGLTVNKPNFKGIVTFCDDGYCEYMHLFTANDFSGELTECDEGELRWIDIKDVPKLELWEGDRYFIDLILKDAPFFSLKLIYEQHALETVILNGEKIK